MAKVVLIVDDGPSNIDLLKGLMPEDVRVQAAISGTIALKLLSKARPDLIFLDLVMPDMSGFEVLQAIRTLPANSDIPVVFVSGNASPADIEKGKALGAQGHLHKPLDNEKLNEYIDTYLNGEKE